MSEIKWISSFGGPFIMASRSSAAQWLGIDGSSALVEDDFSSDYDRASAVQDYAAKIQGNPYEILVLNQGPEDISWVRYSSSSGLIVKWLGADSDEQVVESLKFVNLGEFQELPIRFDIYENNLFFLDSSQTMSEIGENHIEIALTAGSYRISYLNYSPNDRLSLLLIHIERT